MGRLHVIVGPSGAGKDTLMRGAAARRPDIHLVRRAITRPRDGTAEDHLPLASAEFARRCADGAFAVTWRAHGLDYGIPRQELDRDGKLLLNGSRAALPAILRAVPDARVVLVTAPDEVLAERLAARGREDAAEIAGRLRRARRDLPGEIAAQVVMNDATPETGLARFLAALLRESG